MTVFDVKKSLESMCILVDTREQDTERAKNRYARFGIPYDRCKLDFGDYTYNFITPQGGWIYNTENNVSPCISVERKMNLDELCQCFTHDRKRFEREFERAIDAGAKTYLIVENTNWENLFNGKYRSRLNPNALSASLIAWQIRYNIHVYFCKEETTGRLIKEILYRELKERLEGGQYG